MFALVSKKEIESYREDLRNRGEFSEKDWRLFDYHYYRLGVVDNKTASLLQYNGIVIATLAIMIASDRDAIIVNTTFEISLFIMSSLCCFVSIITLLGSVNLHWRVVSESSDIPACHESLLRSTIRRTRIYVRALTFSRVGGLALAALFYLVLARSGIFGKMTILQSLLSAVPGMN